MFPNSLTQTPYSFIDIDAFFVGLAVVAYILRRSYEAYAIYMFFVLLVQHLGERIFHILEAKPCLYHPPPFCHFRFKPGREFFFLCKRMILQFVIIKPTLSLIEVGMGLFGYEETSSFLYIFLIIVDNISISVR
jgi:hypothetical protein